MKFGDHLASAVCLMFTADLMVRDIRGWMDVAAIVLLAACSIVQLVKSFWSLGD